MLHSVCEFYLSQIVLFSFRMLLRFALVAPEHHSFPGFCRPSLFPLTVMFRVAVGYLKETDDEIPLLPASVFLCILLQRAKAVLPLTSLE